MKLILPDVANRAGADQRAWPRRSLRDQRAGARRVHDLEVLVGAGELDRVARRTSKPNRAVDLGQALEPRSGVGHPVELAVLAVADHVDAGRGLLADDLVDRPFYPRRKSRAVVRLVQLLGVQHRHEIGGPRQAAGVRREDPTSAAPHEGQRPWAVKVSGASAARQYSRAASRTNRSRQAAAQRS